MYGLWQCNVAAYAEKARHVRQMLSRGTNKTEGGAGEREEEGKKARRDDDDDNDDG